MSNSAALKPSEQDQFAWHHKPAGWNGAPCPVCGCDAKNLRANHRALTAEEGWRWSPIDGRAVLWIKSVKVCFGTDSDTRGIS